MSIVFAGLAVAAALSAGGPSVQLESAATAPAPKTAAKMLYICQRDAVSKQSFKRLHGEVKFVTAKAVLSSRGDGVRWAAPRCITGAELRRLQAMSANLVYAETASR